MDGWGLGGSEDVIISNKLGRSWRPLTNSLYNHTSSDLTSSTGYFPFHTSSKSTRIHELNLDIWSLAS